MAHELSFKADGTAEFAYINKPAWHGLGQTMREGASIDEWAIAANMNWELQRAAVNYPVLNDDLSIETLIMPERNVLYRSDNKKALSIVSESYKIVQPREVLDFYKDLVGAAGLQLETAGVLFGGKRFWALANTGKMVELAGETVNGRTVPDTVKGYLLLSTSCDGTLATSAQFTSVRVVCSNTLSMALGDKDKSRVRVPHNRVWNPHEVKEQLGFIDTGWAIFKDNITRLSETTAERGFVADYLVELFGDSSVPVDQQSPAVADKCANIWNLYTRDGYGATMESANGTLWGLLNAVTETIDHHTNHHTADARVNSSWYGAGATLKQKAYNLAMEHV